MTPGCTGFERVMLQPCRKALFLLDWLKGTVIFDRKKAVES